MEPLEKMECEACRVGAPLVTGEEIEDFLAQLPDWEIGSVDGVDRIERVFAFKDFAEALAFANRVGAIAERASHHPRICVEWGQVAVAWWSHEAGGLHRNDFILAKKTDEAFDL